MVHVRESGVSGPLLVVQRELQSRNKPGGAVSKGALAAFRLLHSTIGEAMLSTVLLATCQLPLTTISLFQQDATSDFQDLGKLLLGGFVLAVGGGIAITVIRLRMRDKKPPAAEFISISDFQRKK